MLHEHQPLLAVKDLIHRYPDGTEALQNVNLAIPRGRKVVFLGANGAGKSTLFLHFNGVLRPHGGQVLLDGQPLSYRGKGLTELRRRVGTLFQDSDSQLFSARVYEDISFGPMNLGLPVDEVRRRVEWALEQLAIEDLQDKPTHFLSHGQKKRVALAGVLAMEPDLILLDEPTAGLDPRQARRMIELLEELNRQGKTLVMSTHDVDLAYQWADWVYILEGGRLIGEGPPEEVLDDEELLGRGSLERPWILAMSRALGLAGQRPRNRQELTERIQQLGK